jgi:hypothetical protein
MSVDIDRRIYVLRKEFETAVRTSEAALYCHRGELGGGFHLIAEGEIFVRHDDLAYCLNCAVDLAIATVERPNLERGNRIPTNPSPIEPAL